MQDRPAGQSPCAFIYFHSLRGVIDRGESPGFIQRGFHCGRCRSCVLEDGDMPRSNGRSLFLNWSELRGGEVGGCLCCMGGAGHHTHDSTRPLISSFPPGPPPFPHTQHQATGCTKKIFYRRSECQPDCIPPISTWLAGGSLWEHPMMELARSQMGQAHGRGDA